MEMSDSDYDLDIIHENPDDEISGSKSKKESPDTNNVKSSNPKIMMVNN
jgi:hypothetical protein